MNLAILYGNFSLSWKVLVTNVRCDYGIHYCYPEKLKCADIESVASTLVLGESLKLLVIQSAYTYESLCERKLLDFALSKDLGGYFETVYTIHAAATVELDFDSRRRYGSITEYRHSSSHIFLEAKIGRYFHLRHFQRLNFVFSQIGLMIRLINLIRKDRYFLIRAEDPRYNGILAFVLTRFKRSPFIVGSWGNPHRIRQYTGKPLQPRVFKRVSTEVSLEKFLLKRAHCILVQNEDNFNYAVSYGAKKENIKYFRLGNAIHPSHFTELASRHLSQEEKSKIDHDGYKICTISRLEGLKLVDHTLKSFKKMKCSVNSHLYFFGDGSERDSLENLARDFGIEHRIHFLGNVNQESLARLLPHMNLVLSPSMGRALAEVALAELPIVAYDVDCHPDIVKSGKTGILVKYLDIQAMAKAADYLLDHQSEAKQMGKNAREFTLDLMNPRKLMQEQKSIFSELVRPNS